MFQVGIDTVNESFHGVLLPMDDPLKVGFKNISTSMVNVFANTTLYLAPNGGQLILS